MRIGSGSDSVYQLFLPRTKNDNLPDGGGQRPSGPSIRGIGGSASDNSIAAALQAKLAQSAFDRNDSNGDGFVDKQEYIDNSLKPRSDGYVPDQADVERRWSEFDKEGKGRLSKEEFKEGFSSVVSVSVGHFSKPIR
ncbi:EF-hand domain-containing protein [Pararhizobium qamdonense]|uniref:EF-hand domain-containing protein n=1 Tax=Pararhizobium qamdonense TaxID=3031126 RepID=UPI0023E1D7E3|nr:EF-hand domain-containing protein [Pararhizobium qamdonense]